MNDMYRQAGGGGGAGMAVIETKQADYSSSKDNGEYWHDVHNELSPVRKHLIHTYLQIQDEEALPLLGEYFGVALSFMAMGALVRASNSSKKRRKNMSDEERLDLRACSRFQRMALESMLREAMERLRGLAQNAYQMEERVRDLVEAEMEKDNEKGVLLSRIAEAEKTAHELKALRKAEGKANERVMSIVAAKEQDWLKEKRNLQKEIERLKENLNVVCREVKFQSRRCRNPTCEHCKGIERVVRNVRGRVSLRELNSRQMSAHVSPRREVVKVEQAADVEELEEERVLVKALEQKKKRIERPGHLQVQDKVEKHEKQHVNWTGSRSSVNPSGGSAGGAGQFMTKELIAKQQQDMESELANILKRVGMLKQRSHSSSVKSAGQQNVNPQSTNAVTSADVISSLESRGSSAGPSEAVNVLSDKPGSDPTKVEVGKKEHVPNSTISGPELVLADDLTTGLLTLEQEALLSADEDSELLELEKAFEVDVGLVSEGTTSNITDAAKDGNGEGAKKLIEFNSAETTQENETEIDEEAEFAEFESHLASDERVADSEEYIRDQDTEREEAETSANSSPGSSYSEESVAARTEERDDLGPEVELEFRSNLQDTIPGGNADQFRIITEDAAVSETSGTAHTTEVGESHVETVKETENPVEAAIQESLEQCEKQESPRSVNLRGEKSLAEEVKAVDAGNLHEPEQVLEMVETDGGTGLPERQDTSLEDVDNVESSAAETDANSRDQDAISSGEKSDQDADIPVFERAGSRDLVGDLPEPDEKRVCDYSESEVDVAEDARAANKSAVKCVEGENKVDDLVASGDTGIPVESESVADSIKLSADPLEKVNVAEDSPSFSEQISSKVAEEVDSAVAAE